MPKVTRRSRPHVSSNTAPTTTSIASTHNRAPFNTDHNNITIECDKFIVVYEHHQDRNRSHHTRLHISKRGELGRPRVPNSQQQQGPRRSNTIVINNDPSGVTLAVSSQSSENNSLKIIITNSDN